MVSPVVLSSDMHSDVFGKPGTRIVSEYSESNRVLAEYSNNTSSDDTDSSRAFAYQ